MRTIVLYATKHGATSEIAWRIAGNMDDAIVHVIKKAPPLADFDCVIIGSSVYAGAIRREAKAFLSKNIKVLRNKKLGLFISGLDPSLEKVYFDKNFSADILKTAKAKFFLGGILDPKKFTFLDRLMMKIAKKNTRYVNTIDDGKIEQFVKAMVK